MKNFIISVLAIILIGINISNAAIDDISANMQADTLLAGSFIGISVYDISADSALYRYQADKFFTPASNLKLFTSAAALEQLGANFRFKTDFLYRGSIDRKGRLDGDLIVVGGGDPLISGRFRSSVTDVLALWADSLSSRGIKEIRGKLIADNSLFSQPELGAGWSWDDLSYWYACPTSALSFNDNCVDLKFLPGKKTGDPAIIKFDPVTNYINTHNNAVTVSSDSSFTLDYYRAPDGNEVTFFGGIPLGDTGGRKDYVSVARPELYTLNILSDVLKANGIKLSGKINSLDDLNGFERAKYSQDKLKSLFRWQSDSLGVIIKVINTNSQNFFAEQTLKMLGAAKEGKGSFQSGINAAMAYFESIGITDHDVKMYDGSGLSHMDMVRPDAVTRLLAAISKKPDFDVFYQSLANPEIDKGYKNRFKDVSNRGNIRVKSGFIAGVSSLSGYIKSSNNSHLLAFSILINNYNCDKSYVEAWEDSLVTGLMKEY